MSISEIDTSYSQPWTLDKMYQVEPEPVVARAMVQRMEAHTIFKRKRPAGAARTANPIRMILGVKWRCVPMCADFS